MRKHAGKKRTTLVAVCLMIIQLLVGVFTSSPVQADSPWPIALPAGTMGDVFTHGDGSLSVVSGPAWTYSSEGLVTNNLTSSDTLASGMFAAAGVDGTMYVNYRTPNPGPSGGVVSSGIAAYKNSVKLWSYSFTSPCGSNWPYAKNVTLGYNNKLYAFEASSCHNAKLVVLDTSNGSLIQSLDLDTNYNGLQEDTSTRILPLTSGARVLDGQTVKTYVYGATSLSDSHAFSLTGNETIGLVGGDSVGDVYVTIQNTGSGCSYGYTNRVIRMNVDGTQDSFSLSAGGCYMASTIRVAPNKGFVLDDLACMWGICNHVLNGFAADGTLNYGLLGLDDWTGYSNVSFKAPQVDSNGNVYVLRQGIQTGGDHNGNVEVVRINPTGSLQTVFSTEPLNINDNRQVYNSASSWQYTELASGVLYVPLCGASCGGSNPTTLYKASISGLGMDYQRSSVMAALLAQPQKPQLVALGDSFSSGEGNPDFLPGTATSYDACHRSDKAYPVLLDKDSSANLNLTAFVACSGATADDIAHGYGRDSEPNQLNSITSSTNVITVTAGGNDVGFPTFAYGCFTTGCGTGTSVYNWTLDHINNDLPGNLHDLYTAIQAKIGNRQDVAVLVIDYPLVIKPVPFVPCNLTLNEQDENGAYNIELALGGKIADAVGAMHDARFHFVEAQSSDSPFEGHDMCSTSSHFNGLNQNQIYTAHPNADGHQDYAQIVATYWEAIR